MCDWVPVKEGGVVKDTEMVLKGNRFAMMAPQKTVDKEIRSARKER